MICAKGHVLICCQRCVAVHLAPTRVCIYIIRELIIWDEGLGITKPFIMEEACCRRTARSQMISS